MAQKFTGSSSQNMLGHFPNQKMLEHSCAYLEQVRKDAEMLVL
jgi:hypothetical protein